MTRRLPLLAALALPLLAGCGNTALKITPVPADPGLFEQELQRDNPFTLRKIALIDLAGTITDGRARNLVGVEQPNPTAQFVAKLDLARSDPWVKAVVIRVNSPGGTVTASDLCYRELKRFKELSGKPVVIMMMDTAASGAYYTACAGDWLIAYPTSVVGSIGVIMQTFNVAGTMAKLGVEADAIKSGSFKDAGSLWRKMTPAERAYYQKMIDAFYEQFLSAVKAGRPELAKDEKKLRELADGRVYTGQEAKDLGLVDQVGTLREALEEAKKRAKVTAAVVVAYGYAADYRANIYDQPPAPPAPRAQAAEPFGADLSALGDLAQPRFLYLWAAGLP